MTEPRSPFDGTQPPADGQDESTRAIRAISEEDLARPGQNASPAPSGSAWTQPPAPPQGSWGQPAPQQGAWGAPAQGEGPRNGGTPPASPWGAPGQAPQHGGWGGPTATGDRSEDAKSKAFLANLLAGLLGWLGGLIGWSMAKDAGPWAKAQAAKGFNFALANVVLIFVLLVLGFVLMAAGGSEGGALTVIGMVLMGIAYGLVPLVQVVLCIIQALKAKKGEDVKYPYGIPVLK